MILNAKEEKDKIMLHKSGIYNSLKLKDKIDFKFEKMRVEYLKNQLSKKIGMFQIKSR